jgi:hypothetical protein
MQMYGGGSGAIAPRILNLGTTRRWVVSFTPWPLHPRAKHPGINWIGGWVGSTEDLDEKSWPAGNRTPVAQPVASATHHYVCVHPLLRKWRGRRKPASTLFCLPHTSHGTTVGQWTRAEMAAGGGGLRCSHTTHIHYRFACICKKTEYMLQVLTKRQDCT